MIKLQDLFVENRLFAMSHEQQPHSGVGFQRAVSELSSQEMSCICGGIPKSYIQFAIAWYCYGIADAVIGNGSHIQASYEQMEYGR